MLDRTARGNTGGCHDNVEATQFGDGSFDGRIDRCLVRNIAVHLDLSRAECQRRLVDIECGDTTAILLETRDRRRANSRGATSNQDAPHTAVIPPSTTSAEPVTNEARSLAR